MRVSEWYGAGAMPSPEIVYVTRADSPIGALRVASTAAGLAYVELPHESGPGLYGRLRHVLPDAEDARPVKALRVVIQNGHQYLRSEVYLNGYRVAAILRPNTCELAPDAAKLLREGENRLAVFLSSVRGHLHDFDFGLDAAR